MDPQIKTIFFVQRHSLGPEDYKKSKILKELFFCKKLDVLENRYISYLIGLCSEI